MSDPQLNISSPTGDYISLIGDNMPNQGYFLSVVYEGKLLSINMYITIVAILQFFITFNPGPIEQESGLEKGLIDLLCESFYAGYGYWN